MGDALYQAQIGKVTRREPRINKGQSLVEFALVSIFLFMMLVGIIEAGRFLLVYSVISNAAQEGSRYGIVRPRDALPNGAATYVVVNGYLVPTLNGTPIPTQLVVADGSCNIVDKALDKVWTVPRDEVRVIVGYENESGTPVVVNDDPTSPNYYEKIAKVGNRVIVETRYRFNFIAPFISYLMPSGVDVKMSSARTIVNNGTGPVLCGVNYTPTLTPTPTSANTATPTPTWMGTPTITPTSTPTSPPTNTPGMPTTVPTSPPTNTPTRTQTSTPTPAATFTPTSVPPGTGTPTMTGTSAPTDTPSNTPTPTPAACPYSATVDAYKANGYSQVYVRVAVNDALGRPVANAPVSVTMRSTTRTGLADASGLVCVVFPRYAGNSVSGIVGVSGPECYIYSQPFNTQNTSPHSCP